MLIDSQVKVIEHPKSVQLCSEIQDALQEVNAAIQLCFENLDEKTEIGREIAQQLQKAVKAADDINCRAIAAKAEANVLHSSLVKVRSELPGLKKQVSDLGVRLDRQGKRHNERERNNELSRLYDGRH